MNHKLPDVNIEVKNYVKTTDNFAVIALNMRSYAVRTPQNNLSCLDFVHVTRKGASPLFVCAFGSNCGRTNVKVAKKTTKASLCVHEHIVQMIENKVNPTETTSSLDISSEDISSRDNSQFPKDPESDDSHSVWLTNTSNFIFTNHKMDMSFENLRKIETQILEIEKSDEGFPKLYQVREGINEEKKQ